MDLANVPRKLWEHPHQEDTEMYRFMQTINAKEGYSMKSFQDLYKFSVTQRASFWAHLLDFLNIIYTGEYIRVFDENARIDSIPRWFEGVELNFAENLLYRQTPGDGTLKQGTRGKEDNKIAVTEIREGGFNVRNFTWGQLRRDVRHMANAMKQRGVRKGDRIAIVSSNSYDSLKVFLACAALGGVFSSSSTDMGSQGILSRLHQINPKYLFMDDCAVYNGKTIDLRQKMVDVVSSLKDKGSFRGLVVMPRSQSRWDISSISEATTLNTFVSCATAHKLEFEKVDFNDPLMIVYSSGTTGSPKCIVHSVGGALISAAKENVLHSEVSPGSVVLQYTTTGWIMYFLMVAHLFPGAKLILYDGSPFHPDPLTFIKLLADHQVTKLGTSPRWLRELQREGIAPRDVCDLSSLQTISSTGMVLSDQQFEWVYDVAFPPSVHLANISGGTDIAGCFGIENPLTPVYIGGTQGPSLGVPVAVYDSLIEGGDGVKGEPVSAGTPGELVAYGAFPNMPPSFWNDIPSPNKGSKYFSAFFAKYDNVWTHGDSAMFHPVTGQLVFLGRADGVLNPSGIRFGSAEIYAVVDELFGNQISDSVCVGQKRPTDEDEQVMLFLKMKPGEVCSPRLVTKVKAAIGQALSPRHVPKYVFETPDIPTTVNLKKVELPVKHIVSGKRIQPSGTILNPRSLDYFYQFVDVENLVPSRSKL